MREHPVSMSDTEIIKQLKTELKEAKAHAEMLEKSNEEHTQHYLRQIVELREKMKQLVEKKT
jgi:hypothetical protein